MSDAPTPPWGIRVEPDVGNEYAEGIERLQTRLLHIGLFLLTVVMLGGGAGVLMVVTDDSRAVGVSIAVVAGCVVAVLAALLGAMSATRQLTALARRPRPVAPRPRPEPVTYQRETPQVEALRPEARQVEAAPLWARPGEQQVTITDDPGQRREVFVKLARRLQSLINRAIKRIDELEQDNEDPELLDGLYEIDHLFTLARRQGENLAVLGGEAPQRRSNKPVSVYAVLLAAVSEAEHYRQIAIVPVEDVEIHGHAVAEIIHLLAELLENATRFSAPDGPKVEVRAHKVTAGLAIEVQDRGLGMSHEDLERINHLLDGSTRIDLSELLEDGRIGLAVVRELARRHNIRVRLQSNIFGGIAAAVVIPPQLLAEAERESRHRAAQQQQRASALPKRRSDTAEQPALTPSPTPRTGTAADSSPALTPAAEPARVPAPAQSRPEVGLPSLAAPGLSAPEPATSVPSPGERSGPVQVPAPMPIPTAAVTTSAGLGPIRPSQPNHRHRVVEGSTADELPVLPVRAPGRSYDDLRTGGDGVVSAVTGEEPKAPQGDQPPPLPQRRGSHLREELLQPPSPTRPVPGHNTSLMKTVQAGRENWFAQQEHENENRGDQWPTT